MSNAIHYISDRWLFLSRCIYVNLFHLYNHAYMVAIFSSVYQWKRWNIESLNYFSSYTVMQGKSQVQKELLTLVPLLWFPKALRCQICSSLYLSNNLSSGDSRWYAIVRSHRHVSWTGVGDDFAVSVVSKHCHVMLMMLRVWGWDSYTFCSQRHIVYSLALECKGL